MDILLESFGEMGQMPIFAQKTKYSIFLPYIVTVHEANIGDREDLFEQFSSISLLNFLINRASQNFTYLIQFNKYLEKNTYRAHSKRKKNKLA